MSVRIILNDVTFSYAHVFKPKEGINPGESSKYSVCCLIDKTNAADLAKFKEAVTAAIAEGQTGPQGAKFNPAIPSFKMPLRDGDLEKPDREEYAGKMFFNCSASEDRKPEVVDKALQPLNSDSFYSGCSGRISS